MGVKKTKPIIELDKPNGRVKKYWESAKMASEAYKINQANITYNVKGITTQAKGHYFRFATPKEIEQYAKIASALDPISTDPIPVASITNVPNEPVDIIPEVVKRDENQADTLTPFERLLAAGKKKLMDNSK